VAFIYSLEMVWNAERFTKLYWVSHLSLVGNAFGVPFAIGEAKPACLMSVVQPESNA
jgi:hypothetical protein